MAHTQTVRYVHAYTLGAALGSVIYNLGMRSRAPEYATIFPDRALGVRGRCKPPLTVVDRGVGRRFWGVLRPLGMLIVLLDWEDHQQKGGPFRPSRRCPSESAWACTDLALLTNPSRWVQRHLLLPSLQEMGNQQQSVTAAFVQVFLLSQPGKQ